MSARLQKLKALLGRVQDRKQAPRLKAVGPAPESLDAVSRRSVAPAPAPSGSSVRKKSTRSPRPCRGGAKPGGTGIVNGSGISSSSMSSS